MMPDEAAKLEDAVLRIIQLGRDRCGAGFGKYPLGVLDALNELVPSLVATDRVRERLADFVARLSQ
jgi:hypothetical protein